MRHGKSLNGPNQSVRGRPSTLVEHELVRKAEAKRLRRNQRNLALRGDTGEGADD